MAESYGFNYLNKSTFTVYALAILLGVNSLPAQTDLANEPDAEVEDDILTLPLAIDETEDDADDFETFLGWLPEISDRYYLVIDQYANPDDPLTAWEYDLDLSVQ